MKKLLTFKDLKFEPHKYYPEKGNKRAIVYFDNGHWISCIFGSLFYSCPEKNTYEIYTSVNIPRLTNDFIGAFVTPREVTKAIKYLQALPNKSS